MNLIEYLNYSSSYEEYIKRFSYISAYAGVILGFLFALVYSKISNKLLINAVEHIYPDEEIIYAMNIPLILPIIFGFTIGGFTGGFIMPFFLLKNVTHIKDITTSNLWFFIIITLFSFCFLMFFMSCMAIVTENRVIIKRLYPKILKDINIEITSIENITYIKEAKRTEIHTKDGKHHTLAVGKKAKKFYEELKRIMEKDRGDI